MQSDLPHTLYISDRKDKKKGGGEFKYNENDKAIKAQEEAIRRAMERRAAKTEGYTIDQLFKQ